MSRKAKREIDRLKAVIIYLENEIARMMDGLDEMGYDVDCDYKDLICAIREKYRD